MDRSKIACVICYFWATISSTKKSFIDVSFPFRNLNRCGSIYNELLPETKKTNMLVDEDDTATSEEEMDSSFLGWQFHVLHLFVCCRMWIVITTCLSVIISIAMPTIHNISQLHSIIILFIPIKIENLFI